MDGQLRVSIGTFAWSTIIESEAALAEAAAKLLADDRYFDQIDEAQDLIAQPGQDFLRELVHGQPSEPPPVGGVATLTTATALVDRIGDAVTWGIEMARYVTEATGVQVALLTSVYGQMGEMTWIGVQPDLAGVEAVRAKLNSDPEYLRRLTATKELFITGSGYIRQATRIA